MKKTLLLFLLAGVATVSNSQVYRQSFSTDAATVTNGTITDPSYVADPPSTSQLTYLAAPTSGSIGVSSGALRVTTSSASSRWVGVREQINSGYGAVRVSFDANITVGSSSSIPKFVFFVGNSFTNNTIMDATTSIHSGFGIKYENSGYYSVTTLNNTGPTTQYPAGINRTFTFVANSGGAQTIYAAPNGSIEPIGDDKWDLWIDNVKVFDEQTITNPSLHNFNIRSFKFGDINGSEGRADWVIDNFNVEPLAIPLPLRFTGLKAVAKSNSVELTWNCSNEDNVNRYEIEKSSTGSAFQRVSSVIARNIPVEQQYSFTDVSSLAGNSFYRIKSVDKDGKYQYSSIVKVSQSAKAEVAVTPNPVVNHNLNLQLSHLTKGTYWLSVVSVTGQSTYQKNIDVDNGSTTQSIQLPASIKNGSYVLQLGNGSANYKCNIIIQ